ncbi:MAG: AAA family ATPase [Sedimentisphaerales bacterium]|nr:AAA family ATPase [Sedimentisphaerales bacterium]
MRTIAVLNQKGGVGKTTTVVNTAAALAALGAKVIAIDLDPQAHLTIHLGLEPQSIDSGSYKVLTQSARLESEITMVRENLWLLPANIDLVGAESELVSVVGREIILREALEESRANYDYCIIDCAPSLGLLTLNALAAAEEVLIPLQPHFLALQGFGKLLQTVEIVNRRINPNLKVNGILLCMFDSRASLPNEVKADIERFLNEARGTNSAWAEAHVLPVLVRRNIKLAEAPSYGQTIFEYEKTCHGAEDYQKVAEFIHAQTLKSQEPDQTTEVQENSEQPETENSPSDSTLEQNEYSVTSETVLQDDLESQQEFSEENESTQNNSESEYAEQMQEFPPESSDIQENMNQPEQTNIQPDFTSEITRKPPIEIREIPSYDSQKPEQYTQIPEELNQPEKTTENQQSEHPGI